MSDYPAPDLRKPAVASTAVAVRPRREHPRIDTTDSRHVKPAAGRTEPTASTNSRTVLEIRRPTDDGTRREPRWRIPLGILGTGTIGRALLRQLAKYLTADRLGQSPLFCVRGIANSRSMWLTREAFDLRDWHDATPPSVATDIDRFLSHVRQTTDFAPILVDVTASPAIATHHVDWLRGGCHVVTANKLGIAGSQTQYQALRAASTGRIRYAYETTVGAALPVVQTVRDLCTTGDQILMIQGLLSGTLSYLFNTYDGSRPFSELVRTARSRGLTEPDPRADLAGMDVARKLLILAREAGFPLDLDDIKVENLVPVDLAQDTLDDFLVHLTRMDEPLKNRLDEANRTRGVLRYAAMLNSDGNARVGLGIYPLAHAFATTCHTDNLIEVTTERYRPTPLIIRGPGAGADITAAGVLTDILKVVDFEWHVTSRNIP